MSVFTLCEPRDAGVHGASRAADRDAVVLHGVRATDAVDQEIEYESVRKADAEYTDASVEKAGELIGYEPSRTITEGVDEFIEWYEANREWYGALVWES